MALARSLATGASAMVANTERFDVISNNIANSNTTGFKGSRVSFAEQFNQIYTMGTSPDSDQGNGVGGKNAIGFGLGVKTASINRNMTQGPIESTDRPLDMALSGDGMFVYSKNGMQLFSRAGTISRDRDGNLVDSASGAFLQGYNLETDSNGKAIKDTNGSNILNRTTSNLQIPSNIISEPRQTQSITLQGNLNAANSTGTERKTSITVFDNSGGTHTLTFSFTKTANANEYTVSATIDDQDLTLSETTLTFNADGTVNTPTDLQISAADLNTALGGTTIFDETTPKDMSIRLVDPGNLGASLTQFSGSNTVTVSGQDGYLSGELENLAVDSEGKIWGSFSNGQSEVLGQVVVAKFPNQDGLISKGGNFFQVAPNSGLATIGTAGEIFPSTEVVGSALESSNVDLTTEFVDMISTQRAFEAASRSVTTTDAMLQIITQLKR